LAARPTPPSSSTNNNNNNNNNNNKAKSRKVGWARNVAHMGEMRNAYILSQGVGGRTILKLI
jgi:hypothetical protein